MVDNPLRLPANGERGSPLLSSSPRRPRALSGASAEGGGAAPPHSPRARKHGATTGAPPASPLTRSRKASVATAAPPVIEAINPRLAEGGGSPKGGAAAAPRPRRASNASCSLSIKGRASAMSSPTTLRSVRSSRNMSFLDLGAAAAEEAAEAMAEEAAAVLPGAPAAAAALRSDSTTE